MCINEIQCNQKGGEKKWQEEVADKAGDKDKLAEDVEDSQVDVEWDPQASVSAQTVDTK